MNINLRSQLHLKRLTSAVEASRRVLQPHRNKRLEFLREFVGMHYGDRGTSDRVPVNYLQMTTSLYVRAMAARTPRVLVTTPYLSLEPIARNLQIVTQRAIDHMKLDQTIEDMVTEALFGMGIVKVGLTRSPGSPPVDVGTPYAAAVDFSDWVHDTTAKYEHQIQFEGDRYQIDREDLRDDPAIIDPDLVDGLPILDRTAVDDLGETRTTELSRGAMTNSDEGLEEKVELWDLWLPRDNLLVTIEPQSATVLKIIESDDHEQGPYHKLCFNRVPGNLMPLPPAALLFDLHILANKLFTKSMRQATQFKRVVVAPTDAIKDGELFRQSEDGEYIATATPDRVHERAFHGADPGQMAMYLEARNEATRFSGNLDALAGLGPQAQTLGQDQMITGTATERLAAMAEKATKSTSSIVRHLAWMLYTDPVTTYRVPKRIPGSDIQIATAFTPEQRSGDFLSFNFDIEAFSGQPRGPAQQLQALRILVNEFLGPFAPMLQAQGKTVNFEDIFRQAAQYLQYDRADRLIDSVLGPSPMAPGGPDAIESAGKPAITTRNVVRTNRSGSTSQQRDAAMSSALMGVRQNRSTASAAARSPS